jgi:hypothetical protein
VSKLPPFVTSRRAVLSGAPVSKIGPVSLDRTRAQSPEPADTTGGAEHRTFVDTYFTKAPVVGQDTDIVYNGDMVWAKVTLTLETAGPVAVGNLASLTPVLSGKGQLLETDVPTEFFIAKGTRLYISAAGVNRVKRVIEPIPWLEVIAGLVGSVVRALGGAAAALRSKL